MATLGNRPDLFGSSAYVGRYYDAEYEKYEIPPEALEDEQFAAIIKEAEKYLGFPYVWGGSSPATSFDCSGFVSYVYNNCGVGWNFGRLGAEGLRQLCTRVSSANVKPGDLIFFQGTYDTTGASHVGIYVGNNTMLHCGDPIQYSDISSPYWQQHFYQFGRLPSPYVMENGIHLGSWLSNLRTWHNAGAHSNYLTEDRIAQLESIGMIWDVLDYYWERNFLAASEYYRTHRNLRIPSNYVSPDGIRLGAWISRLRALRRGEGKGIPPTAEQIARLDAIGMIWESGSSAKWEAMYQEAKRYYQKHGNLSIPAKYRTSDGMPLRSWLSRQRSSYAKGQLAQNKIDKLNAVGMVWDCGDPWMNSFHAAKKYYEEHGNFELTQNAVVDGVWLGKWIAVQAKRLRESAPIPEEQQKLLETLPLKTESEADRIWKDNFEDLCSYVNSNGSFNIPAKYTSPHGVRLSAWATVQRMKKGKGELSAERISKLDAIGFPWKIDRWEQSYALAKAYVFHQ